MQHFLSRAYEIVVRESFEIHKDPTNAAQNQRREDPAFWLHLAVARNKLREDGPVPKTLPPFRPSSSRYASP